MRELREKQKVKNRLYSTPTLAILFIITLLIIRGAFGVMMKERESQRLVSDLEVKEQTLADHEIELKNSIDRLQTDEGLDSEIKEKYSVAKPGEHVVVIVDPRPLATTTASTSPPWYRAFWKSIIGN